MKKFLFTTLPSNDLGLLTRSLPIATELTQYGHEITYCSPAKAPSKLIAEAGFDNLLPKHPIYFFLSEKPSLKRLYRITKTEDFKQDYGHIFNFLWKLVRAIPLKFAPITAEVWNMDHAAAMAGMLNKNFVRANCEAMRLLILDYDPDVVVDFWNPFACMAAKTLQKPLVAVMQADQHPANRGFIWWKAPPANLPTPVPTINRVLSEYGLPPVKKIDELNAGNLTLMLGTPETDPLPEGTPVTYIGPILWQKAEAKLPDWIDKLNQDKPVIWVYPGNPRYLPSGTPMDSTVVLQACFEALAGEAVQVVLTTGHHTLPKEFRPLPANFRHEAYVPGLAMAHKSDLMIHHGGYGSCQTGLYTGTPAVIIPTFSERESNARRIAALGAGDFVAPGVDTSGKKFVDAEAMRAKVRHVLSDPSFTKNARRISEKLQTYGGASEAARLIENFSTGES
jgi:UDP:flavonoid glycosyltransferase YjiC (YdhE family)